MQERQFDTEALISRATEMAKEIRKSDAYPALIGGIAGGIAGGLIAALIAGRIASSRNGSAESAAEPKSKPAFRWDVKDMVQLATIVATLAKQVQKWYKDQNKSE
ncbi:MAG: hypothetical protein HY782_22940 [Chloroflexi bacterium]|nr:hypothetical protein [Chloroflexota bacterium]